METSRSRSFIYESRVLYVMRSLGGAVATLSISCGIHDAKFRPCTSSFLMTSFFDLGNRVKELGGSPFCCKTDPKGPISSCLTFSFDTVSRRFFGNEEEPL